MIKITNKSNTNTATKVKETTSKYILTTGISASILLLAALSEAANSAGSVGVISEVMTSITNFIKTEGKIGLQILSAAAWRFSCC